MVPALVLMAVGPVANWKSAKVKALIKQLRPPAGVAVIIGIGVPFLMGRWSVAVAMGVAVAAWIATAVVTGILQRMRATRSGDRKSTRLNSSHYCASRMPSSACKK